MTELEKQIAEANQKLVEEAKEEVKIILQADMWLAMIRRLENTDEIGKSLAALLIMQYRSQKPL